MYVTGVSAKIEKYCRKIDSTSQQGLEQFIVFLKLESTS